MPAPVSPLPKLVAPVPPVPKSPGFQFKVGVNQPIEVEITETTPARIAIAKGIRNVGATVDLAGKDMGVVSEQAALKPVEAAYALGKVVGQGMEKIPFTKKYAGMASVAFGLLALIGTQSIAGIAKAPGDFASDVTGSVADAIEGTVTPRKGFGFATFLGGSSEPENLANQHRSIVVKNEDR